MKFTTIIFDMDGTIVETGHLWAQVNKTIIERRGVTFTPDIEKYLAIHLNGLALPLSCAIVKDIIKTDEPIELLMKEKAEVAAELYAKGLELIHGFESFHAKVIQSKLKTGLATNADDSTFAVSKRLLNLERFFGIHLYNISHVNFLGKPHPAIYLYAAEKLESDPSHCIAIEDSTHGITAAKNAGMFCIGINTGKDKEKLNKADLIIDHYDDIKLEDIL